MACLVSRTPAAGKNVINLGLAAGNAAAGAAFIGAGATDAATGVAALCESLLLCCCYGLCLGQLLWCCLKSSIDDRPFDAFVLACAPFMSLPFLPTYPPLPPLCAPLPMQPPPPAWLACWALT